MAANPTGAGKQWNLRTWPLAYWGGQEQHPHLGGPTRGSLRCPMTSNPCHQRGEGPTGPCLRAQVQATQTEWR